MRAPRTGAGVVSEVYGRSLVGASSETMARGETPNFNLAKRDEREPAAHEAPLIVTAMSHLVYASPTREER